MPSVFDCRDADQILTGMRLARQAIGRGELVVLPTDTVYGVGADAFSPAAVQRLLEAKGRGRQQPPPVLVGSLAALNALVEVVPEPVQRLVDEFWPGGLTGQDAAIDIAAAEEMLGDSIAVYLDHGRLAPDDAATGVASTIIDATSLVRPGGEDAKVRVLRDGAISRAELARVLGDLLEERP